MVLSNSKVAEILAQSKSKTNFNSGSGTVRSAVESKGSIVTAGKRLMTFQLNCKPVAMLYYSSSSWSIFISISL